MNLKTSIKKALDEHFILLLIISSLVIVSGMFIIHFTTYKPQRFSALGLLDENGEITEFPDEIAYNETLDIQFTVQNHQGMSELYQIRMMYGDAGTIIDPVVGSIGGYEKGRWQNIVPDGGQWNEPITLSFNVSDTGMTKIIFELWIYDAGNSIFTFENISTHVWIDVTGPT